MRTQSVPVTSLRRHASNARSKSEYTRAELSGLVESIREHGLLSPLVVTSDGDGFTVLAGHRRLAALRVLGMEQAPCVVVDADEAKSLAILLADNAQHEPVDVLKESDTVARLVDGLSDQQHPYDRAASLVGKSPSWIRDRLRLRALSSKWRQAFGDPKNPVHQWPGAHLAVVAALPEAVQDQVLADNEASFAEGVPLALELRRLVAEYTRDLSQVAWRLDDAAVVDGAPACNDCPKRDVCEGFLFRGVTDTKKPRCLDALCFEAKRDATVKARIRDAIAKHGDALGVERCWSHQDVELPEGVPVFQEFELVPLAKSKGGRPVLRLKTLTVSYMGPASKDARAESRKKAKRDRPATLDERRAALERRRTVRALELLRGSLLGRDVDVGTEKRPETATPPSLAVPALDDLVALCLAFGTGRSVDDDEAPWDVSAPDRLAIASKTVAADSAKARTRLWARLRDPVAKALQPQPGLTDDAAAERASVAQAVCRMAGVDWAASFVAPSVAALPEPKAWARAPRRRTRVAS